MDKTEASPKDRATRARRRLLVTLAVLVAAPLLLLSTRLWLYDLYRVPSGSMFPTLERGDLFVVSRLDREPEAGEVITFRYPMDPSVTYVKRAVGLPGDTVQLTDGVVRVNGRPLPQTPGESVVHFDRECRPHPAQSAVEDAGGRSYEIAQGRSMRLNNYGPVTVRPDHYFVLGDNRDHSSDSRVWGLVPQENIIGAGWKRLRRDRKRCGR